MSLSRSRAAGTYAVAGRAGSKLSRPCPACNAQPGTRCWKLPIGKYVDGVDKVPLERQKSFHKQR